LKAIVIGSGIAGLATAVRLSCAGYTVEVFEANQYPGGKLTEISRDGYRFDAGPSLFTLPNLVDELFLLAGKKPRDYFNYIKLEKSCNYFYEDGTRFTAYHDRNKFAEELQTKLGIGDVEKVMKHLEFAAWRYKITAPVFIEYSLHRLKNYINKNTVRGILSMFRLNLFESMHKENTRLLSNKKLVQYFNRFATYNGSSPYKAPALLNMIPHLEHNIGTFFPDKGMHSITQSIFDLAKSLGIQFHFGKRVDEILVNKETAIGVKIGGMAYMADIVVSNADIHPTYHKLLPNERRPDNILSQEKSSSALIFYWGINRSFQELDLHNILFADNYENEFEQLFQNHTICKDPTVYINITSKYNSSDAPDGCENWFVMINVPNNQGQDWENLTREARKHIIEKINRLLVTDIENHIATEEVLDPITIEQKTGSHAGALYGNASNNRFAAFLRHKNFSSNIKGLYFCGGSVHPGGGIPLCLNSAKIVSKLIQEDTK
jgi:phytoene desaturase